jgi:hypothetical protein
MFGIDWLRAGVPVDKDASVLTSEEEPVFEPSNCGCQTSWWRGRDHSLS